MGPGHAPIGRQRLLWISRPPVPAAVIRRPAFPPEQAGPLSRALYRRPIWRALPAARRRFPTLADRRGTIAYECAERPSEPHSTLQTRTRHALRAQTCAVWPPASRRFALRTKTQTTSPRAPASLSP